MKKRSLRMTCLFEGGDAADDDLTGRPLARGAIIPAPEAAIAADIHPEDIAGNDRPLHRVAGSLISLAYAFFMFSLPSYRKGRRTTHTRRSSLLCRTRRVLPSSYVNRMGSASSQSAGSVRTTWSVSRFSARTAAAGSNTAGRAPRRRALPFSSDPPVFTAPDRTRRARRRGKAARERPGLTGYTGSNPDPRAHLPDGAAHTRG